MKLRQAKKIWKRLNRGMAFCATSDSDWKALFIMKKRFPNQAYVNGVWSLR